MGAIYIYTSGEIWMISSAWYVVEKTFNLNIARNPPIQKKNVFDVKPLGILFVFKNENVEKNRNLK